MEKQQKREKGETVGALTNTPPMEYIFMQYRHRLNLSYREFVETPPEIVFSDLFMMATEDEARTWVTQKTPLPKVPRVPKR